MRMHVNYAKEVVGYEGIHEWLKINYGKADCCESFTCTNRSRNYQWARKKGCRYERKRKNFLKLCVSCHAIYDGKMLVLARKKLKKVVAISASKRKTFKSINDAASSVGIVPTGISNVLNGRAYTAGGFKWIYA